jgi:hypothetical protein
MSIEIPLTPEEERRLAELAGARGKDESRRGAKGAHGDNVVAPYLNGADEARMKSFEEMLAPDWAEFGRSDMADGEVDDQFKREIRFFWTKGHRPKRMP